MKFSKELVLKAVGGVKCTGRIIYGIGGTRQRSEFIDYLVDELKYVCENCRELTPSGNSFLKENFLEFDNLTKNDKRFF